MARVSAGVTEGPSEASLLLRAGDLHRHEARRARATLVVTDRYMASVVNGLHLGEKYNATIIPSTNEGLREAATWLAVAATTATGGEHR